MRDILLAFGPYDEFNAFNRFNVNLLEFKKQYKHIIAVVPYTAACIMTNVDELICASNEFLEKAKANYPCVLDYMLLMERYDYGYGHSGFMKEAYNIAYKKYGDNFDIVLNTVDNFFEDRVYMPHNYTVMSSMPLKTDIYPWIWKDFELIKQQLIDGYKILPFKDDFFKMENKYSRYVTKNSYIIYTRNFKKKQPDEYNTNLFINENDLLRIIDLGYDVINIGFPPVDFKIHNNKYYVVEENLTYSEQLAISSMARGVLLQAHSAGFSTHVCSDLDLFLLTEEWQKKDFFYNARLLREDLYTNKINSDNMIEIIKNHNPKNNNSYIDKKDITII